MSAGSPLEATRSRAAGGADTGRELSAARSSPAICCTGRPGAARREGQHAVRQGRGRCHGRGGIPPRSASFGSFGQPHEDRARLARAASTPSLKMLVMVNASAQDFKDQPKVANGMFDLFVEGVRRERQARPLGGRHRGRCRGRFRSEIEGIVSIKTLSLVGRRSSRPRKPNICFENFRRRRPLALPHGRFVVSIRLCISCCPPVIGGCTHCRGANPD